MKKISQAEYERIIASGTAAEVDEFLDFEPGTFWVNG
jgi:hypothetical protein